jgi:hypothetical protein
MNLRALVDHVKEPHDVRVLHLRQRADLIMYCLRSFFLLQILLIVSFDSDRRLRLGMDSPSYLSESTLTDPKPNLKLFQV